MSRSVRWLPGLVEAAASLLAVYAVGALLINKADATIAFFGETATVTAAHVATYHRWLAVLGVAVLASFGAALWRRRPVGRSVYWHGFVLVVGLLAAVVLRVAVAAPTAPTVPEHRSGPVCRSGGDSSECPGG